MKQQSREEPEIVAAVERRMHAWVMSNEHEDRAAGRHEPCQSPENVLRFVAISREAGIDAGEVAKLVGKRLGWDVFDANLLDRIAERFHVSRMMLDLVDETRSNWVYDVLGSWMDRKLVPHEKFVAHLTRIILAESQKGHAVIVGRGAQFLLPRKEILAVRLVASPKYRTARIMEHTGMNESDAVKRMEEIDCGRREFVERFFRHDITDPHLFDLVINVECCGMSGAVDDILAAVARNP